MIFENGAEETCEETGPFHTGLWARVRHWLATWTAVFPPDEILRDGLTRRFALRCCNWLRPLEATVRRLIIAAALAFDGAKLASAPSHRERLGPRMRAPAPPKPAGFRIISIRGAGRARGIGAVAGRRPHTDRHLPFPGDDLLSLGLPSQRCCRKQAQRRPNPLHRRGRILRTDPDFMSSPETDYANSSELLFGSDEDRETPPARQTGAGSPLLRYVRSQPDESEWRRIEKEWERSLPAPGIAARIDALCRILEAPESSIERLARRLAARPDLATLLRNAPPPLLRKPKYDRLLPQVDDDLPMLAYGAIRFSDTS